MSSRQSIKTIGRAARMPVKVVYKTFREFAQLEASGGIVLIIAALIALVWANSPWSHSYFEFWEIPLSISLGGAAMSHGLHWWINEAIMVIFFLVVGLEIKREVMVGELSSFRQAILPIATAIGGMVMPATIYLLFNLGGVGERGWGVPMATDIAFALGVMALLGPRIPVSLKIFLTGLAIVDDIGAVLVIALFYSVEIQWAFVGAAAGLIVLLALLNALGVRKLLVYSLLGILLWLAVLFSGLHATLAGVILAFLIPARNAIHEDEFVHKAQEDISDFKNAGKRDRRMLNSDQQEALHSLETSIYAVQTPLRRLEHGLHPWVTFVIIPLFALANAGVHIPGDFSGLLANPITLGVMAGLVIGKQIGVVLASWLVVRMGLADLPRGVNWRQIYGAGWLAGIGFTMSLFISELAFIEATSLEAAKIGILLASLFAGVVGYIILRVSSKPEVDQAA